MTLFLLAMKAELLEASNKRESKVMNQDNSSKLIIQWSDLMQLQISLEEQEGNYKEEVVEGKDSKELSSVSITEW